jgi:tRNA 2-selenouridine synthase SelU
LWIRNPDTGGRTKRKWKKNILFSKVFFYILLLNGKKKYKLILSYEKKIFFKVLLWIPMCTGSKFNNFVDQYPDPIWARTCWIRIEVNPSPQTCFLVL